MRFSFNFEISFFRMQCQNIIAFCFLGAITFVVVINVVNVVTVAFPGVSHDYQNNTTK